MKACSIDQRRSTIDRSALALLVGVQDQVDGGIADRMRRDAPVLAVQLANRGDVTFGVDRLQAAERAVLVPGLFVEIAHQPAFEAAVDGELDAADAQQLVAFVLLDARRGQRGIDAVGADRRAQQRVDANRQLSALLHLLQHSILGDRDAGMANARQARFVQLLVIGDAIVELLLRRPRRRRRQADQRLRGIDELAVQPAVGISRDAAAGGLRRCSR